VWYWLAAVVLLAGCSKKPRLEGGADLHWSAKNGNVEQVQTLIARGASVNVRDKTDRTPLHDAACNGHKEVAEVLVRCGATIDAMDRKGSTPVMEAMQNNHRVVVEYLVGQGAAVDLHLAVYLGDAARSKGLIDRGLNVNAKDQSGWTPLHYAASCGYREVAELLIGAGANPNSAPGEQSSMAHYGSGVPLHCAVRADHRDIVELLLDNGADVNARDREGMTSLYWAVRQGRLEMVNYLLAKGADANIRTGRYSMDIGSAHVDIGTPLGVAVEEGYVEIAEALVSGGADLKGKSTLGWTPLHAAIMSHCHSVVDTAVAPERLGQKTTPAEHDRNADSAEEVRQRLRMQIVRFLIAHGAQVKAKDKENVTPLHCAAYMGQTDIVQLLLAEGAEVNARTVRDPNGGFALSDLYLNTPLPSGATPIHAAVVDRDPNVVDVLTAHGGQLDAKDESGRTPLHYAVVQGDAGPVQFLITRGADVNARADDGAIPLADALLAGHVQIAKMLIVAGSARVDIKDRLAKMPVEQRYGRTPLLHGAMWSMPWLRRGAGDANRDEEGFRREWIELLLVNGADPNERDDMGDPLLFSAILAGDEELARICLAHGTDVNARNKRNDTALHYAAKDNLARLASLLLEKGVDMNARDNGGETPLHTAALRGHREVIEVLLAHGADVSLKNNRGRMPADEANRHGHKDIVQMLTPITTDQGTHTQGNRGEK
jgi:ankyrin repeat protein